VSIRVWLVALFAVTVAAGTISTLAGATAGGTIVFGFHVHGKPDHVVVARPNGTGRVSMRLPAPGCSGCLQVSSDGTHLLTAAYEGKRITTAVEKLDGSGYRAFRLPGQALNLGPGAWSTDGRRIAFEGWAAQGAQNGMYTGSAADGSGLRRVTTSSGRSHDIPLVYSPDGRWILFARSATADDSKPADLYAVRTDGTALQKLNPSGTGIRWGFFGSPATWSADSRTIAFAALDRSAFDTGRSAVFTISPRGSRLHRITPWEGWTTSAHFSPSGAWIAFDRLPGHDLLLMRPDGTGVRTVVSAASGGLGSCCASWSPDSTQLVFQRGDPSAATLWTVKADGTALKEISSTAGEYAFYAWVP
jgi:tricorn protease-like protein